MTIPNDSKRLRICFVADGEIHGGVATSLRTLLEVHAPQRYAFMFVFTGEGCTQRQYQAQGYPSWVLPVGPVVGSSRIENGRKRFNPAAPFWWVYAVLRWAPALASILRRRHVDIVYSNQYFHHLLAGVAGRLAGVPSIWHVRMVMSRQLLGGLAVKAYSALAARLASRVVCISRAVAGAFSNAVRTKVRVVYNRVTDWSRPSPQRLESLRQEMGGGPGKVVVGLVARISFEKGIEVFLRAAEALRREEPIRFVLVGGPQTPEEQDRYDHLKAFVADRGLGGKVAFLGFRRDVRDLYPAMDLLCSCSLSSEGFNYTLAEGLCAGLPCVASRCGGQEEVVEDRVSGFLYEPGDVEALSRRIGRLASDPQERGRMALAARDRFSRMFEAGGLIRDLEEVYSSIQVKRRRG